MNFDESTLKNGLFQDTESVHSIQSTLSQIMALKKLLKEKAVVAKNQIQDDVSFHMELLRNREVWLQEQVDFHVEMKEEVFENLLGLLAKLEAYWKILEAPDLHGNEVILCEVKEIFSRISKETQHSEELSNIFFTGDNFAMCDAIKNFGSIVENKPCEPVRKMPRIHKKKFVSRESSHGMFIQEHFKRVKSSPPEEWLIDGGDLKETRKDYGVPWKYFEELKKSDDREWLYQKCQPMDLTSVSNNFKMHFKEVIATPAGEWLQSGTFVMEGSSNLTARHSSLDTSENIQAWLIRPMGSLSLSSKGDEMVDEGISLSRHPSYEPNNSEMQVIGEVLNDWLLTEAGTPYQAKVAQNSSWLQRFQESSGSSTSDWLIVPEVEPDYCEWLTQESIDRCKSCPGECARDTFKVFRNVLNSSRSEWLVTATDW